MWNYNDGHESDADITLRDLGNPHGITEERAKRIALQHLLDHLESRAAQNLVDAAILRELVVEHQL